MLGLRSTSDCCNVTKVNMFLVCGCQFKSLLQNSSSYAACQSKIIKKKKVLSRTESYSPCRDFVEEKLGSKYVIGRTLDFAVSFEESGPATPMFFILSPGVDPLKDVEKHGDVLHLFFISTEPLNSAFECVL